VAQVDVGWRLATASPNWVIARVRPAFSRQEKKGGDLVGARAGTTARADGLEVALLTFPIHPSPLSYVEKGSPGALAQRPDQCREEVALSEHLTFIKVGVKGNRLRFAVPSPAVVGKAHVLNEETNSRLTWVTCSWVAV